MISAEVRSFTTLGFERFRAWLDQAETSEPKRLSPTPPPSEILFDDRWSRPIGYGGEVNQRRFEKKYELGMEVCRALGVEGASRLMPDANAWAWLSLFFHYSHQKKALVDRSTVAALGADHPGPQTGSESSSPREGSGDKRSAIS